MDVATSVDLATVGNQVHFHATRRWLMPIGKGAHLDPLPRFWHGPYGLSITRRALWQSEQAVDRRSTHRQDLGTYFLIELQMSIALQRRQQNGQQCLQSLATQPIGGFPQHN